MTRLVLYGRPLEVSPEALADWAIAELVGPLEIVALAHWASTFSMPTTPAGNPTGPLQAILRHLRENESVIEDPVFSSAVREVRACLEAAVHSYQALHSWEQTNVLQSTRAAHQRIVAREGPRHPPWSDHDEFRSSLAAFSSAFSTYLDTLPPVIARVQAIAPGEAEKYQLSRTSALIPQYRDILALGYDNAIRRAAQHPPSA